MGSAILAGLGAQVARQGAQAIGNMAAQFVGGKVGETIGGHNEQAADELRAKAAKLNVDPATYARMAAHFDEESAQRAQGRSRSDAAFGNQMNMSNQRAYNTMDMARQDQLNAQDQALSLAKTYGDAATRQSQASNNMITAMMGRR
jgi:hypothetical protein